MFREWTSRPPWTPPEPFPPPPPPPLPTPPMPSPPPATPPYSPHEVLISGSGVRSLIEVTFGALALGVLGVLIAAGALPCASMRPDGRQLVPTADDDMGTEVDFKGPSAYCGSRTTSAGNGTRRGHAGGRIGANEDEDACISEEFGPTGRSSAHLKPLVKTVADTPRGTTKPGNRSETSARSATAKPRRQTEQPAPPMLPQPPRRLLEPRDTSTESRKTPTPLQGDGWNVISGSAGPVPMMAAAAEPRQRVPSPVSHAVTPDRDSRGQAVASSPAVADTTPNAGIASIAAVAAATKRSSRDAMAGYVEEPSDAASSIVASRPSRPLTRPLRHLPVPNLGLD